MYAAYMVLITNANEATVIPDVCQLAN